MSNISLLRKLKIKLLRWLLNDHLDHFFPFDLERDCFDKWSESVNDEMVFLLMSIYRGDK